MCRRSVRGSVLCIAWLSWNKSEALRRKKEKTSRKSREGRVSISKGFNTAQKTQTRGFTTCRGSEPHLAYPSHFFLLLLSLPEQRRCSEKHGIWRTQSGTVRLPGQWGGSFISKREKTEFAFKRDGRRWRLRLCLSTGPASNSMPALYGLIIGARVFRCDVCQERWQVFCRNKTAHGGKAAALPG